MSRRMTDAERESQLNDHFYNEFPVSGEREPDDSEDVYRPQAELEEVAARTRDWVKKWMAENEELVTK